MSSIHSDSRASTESPIPSSQFSEESRLSPSVGRLASQVFDTPPAPLKAPLSPARVKSSYHSSTTRKVIAAVGRFFLRVAKVIFSIAFVFPAIDYFMDRARKKNLQKTSQDILGNKFIDHLNVLSKSWNRKVVAPSLKCQKQLDNIFDIASMSRVERNFILNLDGRLQSLYASYETIVSSAEYGSLPKEDPFIQLMKKIGEEIAPFADGIDAYEQLDGEFAAMAPVQDEPIVNSPPPAHYRNRSLSESSISVENDREGGHKYHQAILGLSFAFEDFAKKANKTPREILHELEKKIETDYKLDARSFYRNQIDSPINVKNFLLLDLYCTIRAMNDPISEVREVNRVIVTHLRHAHASRHYQLQKDSSTPDIYVQLAKRLFLAKYTEVFPYESFKNLIDSAVSSNGQQPMSLSDISYKNVGQILGDWNHKLEGAAEEFKKSKAALAKQKFQGEFGINNDPGGTSNVPYVRSLFTFKERDICFCRFGSPTIQAWGEPTRIDPIFLGALEGMENKQFLYVNHQKPTGREAERYQAIKGVEKTHENFHFLSIPLDGEIVKQIQNLTQPLSELKQTIIDSFLEGKNGCALPAALQGDRKQLLEEVLRDVQNDWGFSEAHLQTREGREAFWGIFNTLLKHRICDELNIDAMNSSCKDNKDRGGTLSSIDEAVRNVMLNKHKDPETLRELIYNALSPYMIKLEEILNKDTKDGYRLGYLINVLNHIAKLSDEKVGIIQDKSPVTKQWIPKGAMPIAPDSPRIEVGYVDPDSSGFLPSEPVQLPLFSNLNGIETEA